MSELARRQEADDDNFYDNAAGPVERLSHGPRFTGELALLAFRGEAALEIAEDEPEFDLRNVEYVHTPITDRERDRRFLLIANAYREHPEAVKAGERFRNKNSLQLERNGDLSLVGLHYQEVGFYDLLTFDQEKELFAKIDAGLEQYSRIGLPKKMTPEQEKAYIEMTGAYQAIIKSNQRLVVKNARYYSFVDLMDFSDLIAEGNIGLSKAVRRFDTSKGYKFSTYATYWVRQSIAEGLATQGRTIRLPYKQHSEWLRVEVATQQLGQELGREPDLNEVAERTGYGINKVKAINRGITRFSLDRPAPFAENKTLSEVIPDPEGIEAEIEKLEDKDEVEWRVSEAKLTNRNAAVVCLYSGVYLDSLEGKKIPMPEGEVTYEELMSKVPTEKGLTQQDIARLFGMTPQNISRILVGSLRKMSFVR